jgi:hypothetical protein
LVTSLIVKVVEEGILAGSGKLRSYVVIADDTGCVQLNLHGKQVNHSKMGMTVRITGAFTEVVNGTLEVYSLRY